jgi:hypothetical protein
MQLRNRKRFLSALTAGGAALALAARRSAGAAPAGQASPAAPSAPASGGPVSPPAAPPASPASPGSEAEKAPSAAALAAALTMRRFDPALSDAQIARIARDIDDGRAGEALNPKKKPLLNSDEPVTIFRVQP